MENEIKLLSVGSIRKTNTSYGNYAFTFNYRQGERIVYETVFEFGLKKINFARNKMLTKIREEN